MKRQYIDKLMDLTNTHSQDIAEKWYNSLINNVRTISFKTIPKDACIRQAVDFYTNLGKLYFSADCYKAVNDFLESTGYAEFNYGKGIPVEEVLYSLIMMRRHIWLNAEAQALFADASDMYMAVESINRTILIFDYATYVIAGTYRRISTRKYTFNISLRGFQWN